MKKFNMNIRFEKAKRLMKSKVGFDEYIEVPENTLHDHKNDMPITWITLYEDNSLTCFSQQSSDYFVDVDELDNEDFNAVIDFIINFFDKKVVEKVA